MSKSLINKDLCPRHIPMVLKNIERLSEKPGIIKHMDFSVQFENGYAAKKGEYNVLAPFPKGDDVKSMRLQLYKTSLGNKIGTADGTDVIGNTDNFYTTPIPVVSYGTYENNIKNDESKSTTLYDGIFEDFTSVQPQSMVNGTTTIDSFDIKTLLTTAEDIRNITFFGINDYNHRYTFFESWHTDKLYSVVFRGRFITHITGAGGNAIVFTYDESENTFTVDFIGIPRELEKIIGKNINFRITYI